MTWCPQGSDAGDDSAYAAGRWAGSLRLDRARRDAVSINIVLLGTVGPFLTGLADVIGFKRTILICMAMLIAGSASRSL
jgi:hypothetical protein